MYRTKKAFRCQTCSHDFEKFVVDAVVSAACPQCARVSQIAQSLGLGWKEAVSLGLAFGFFLWLANR